MSTPLTLQLESKFIQEGYLLVARERIKEVADWVYDISVGGLATTNTTIFLLSEEERNKWQAVVMEFILQDVVSAPK